MAFSSCSTVNRICSIGILVAILFSAVFSCSWCSGLLIPIALTSLVLVISSQILLTFTRQSWPVDSPCVEAMETKYECSAPMMEDRLVKLQEDSNAGLLDDSMASESECINPSLTSEDSDVEVDWPLDQPTDSSDGSISDEESLFEIAIPSRHYIVSHKEVNLDDHKLFNKKAPAFFPNSVFHGNSQMDLIGEINDEDNMIEIDLSAGLIKCSRFGIKA